MTRPAILSLASAALLVASAGATGAQSIATRVDRVREGDIRFTFPLRPDVCGRGRSVWYDGNRSNINWNDERRSGDVEYDVDCDSGPGRIVVVKVDGEVTGIRFYVGGRWRASTTATDLGAAGAQAASEFLISLVSTANGKAARDAIFPLTLVDSVTVWPALMKVARSDSRPRDTRTQAVFWLGQLAEKPATAGLNELAGDDTLDREVRKQALFALSQRRDTEGIPSLIRVVRTSKDPELRKTALFWLAQSKDARALDLIEELLSKR